MFSTKIVSVAATNRNFTLPVTVTYCDTSPTASSSPHSTDTALFLDHFFFLLRH